VEIKHLLIFVGAILTRVSVESPDFYIISLQLWLDKLWQKPYLNIPKLIFAPRVCYASTYIVDILSEH